MKITLALIQGNVLFGKIKKNLENALQMIRQAADKGAQIICLPELFIMGYDFKSIEKHFSEKIFTEIIHQLSELAESLKIYLVAGSIPEIINKKIYNTSFFFNDQGTLLGKYQKIHLFPPMEEQNFFSPGQDCPLFTTSLAKIGICICYDLRFPHQFSDLAQKGAEIILVPAQFPHPRLDHWRILLRARAIDNFLFVAGCNRMGKDKSHIFCGHSSIISPWGKIIAEAGEREMIVTAEIDLNLILESRLFFNT